MSEGLGIGVGIVGIPTDEVRVGTKSPYDFAFWASKFVSPGTVFDYSDLGPETDGLSLVIWAASKIGLTFPQTFSQGVAACQPYKVSVDQALRMRGALLISGSNFGVTLGLNDVIDVINGRYFVYRAEGYKKDKWITGAKLPGAIY